MGERTDISWCDSTFNPWEGCTKISEGCAHCYAEVRNKRFGGDNWGKGKSRHRTSAANWRLPLKWNREAADMDLQWKRKNFNPQERTRVFCASLADWLDDEVPIEWLADLLKLIHDTPNLDWLLLTKRPEKFFIQTLAVALSFADSHNDEAFLEWLVNWSRDGMPPANVWIGTSVEDQQRADERIPELLKIPARVRFLSVEPMLGRLVLPWKPDYSENTWAIATMPGLHWIIFGGESGPGARHCNVEWIRDGIAQCRGAGVAPFVKQLGAFVTSNGMTGPGRHWPTQVKKLDINFPDGLGFQHLLKDKKGGDMNEWPTDLRVREFPESL